ncbi:polynucleotide kinase-phosphatase [Chlorogloea sp. CCALA 695]|uniref:polynucleotide kinase-phosphatase n=1 Tax=Chlorogloea sp. CCALA 695 TaxID=2107693 RepID=UPI000D06073B|nr:polynucleotide kinase-phosphatase [Chlorogloea sp. CCALA 695]PSB32127.1 polynucleotide kinase-phosphatase [Chlorogloea sp. CCALA 695]
MKITIPELSLVVLMGASGAGKSSFAKKHFKSTEVISSDFCRGLICDDENNQAVSKDAFAVVHYIAAKRLAAGKLTVIDATNVQKEDRKHLLELAKEYHCLPVAIALNLPEQLCHDRNQQRPNRNFGVHVVRRQRESMRQSLKHLKREGFRYSYILNSVEDIEEVSIYRQPLWNNRKTEHGPFDIIGDIHGCCDELEALLQKLGYEISPEQNYFHPQGRKALFLGDLVDRGNRILDTLALVQNMVVAGTALCVPGNHDMKLMRKLQGKNVKITHGLDKTLAEIDALPDDKRELFSQETVKFLDSLISHYVLDDGNLVVAHAGMKEALQGRGSGRVRDFALYGETTGETDDFGLPVRYDWAAEYRGKAIVVYGHTPVIEAQWLNGTIDIDTGCVYGGKLTALRYPEKELVSVAAQQVYCESTKPFLPTEEISLTTQQQLDDVLDIDDVLGKRVIETRTHGRISIRAENAIAAIEVMSRFAANPKWLIYLPPTMSPCETSKQQGLLEHPSQAFTYYQNQGVSQVICEEKHMGSRAVVIICRDEEAARDRFGVIDEGIGICYTRTGRRFFSDAELESQMLAKVQNALEVSGFWEQFNTSWVALDCELMPWSAKAQELLQRQYAAVGAAANSSLNQAVSALEMAAKRINGVETFLTHYQNRAEMAAQYVEAYRRYCWQVESLADLKLAPFHILATEGEVHNNKTHVWHMETLAQLCKAEPELLLATAYKLVDVNDTATGVAWWEELTSIGGEGIVVKPLDFVFKGDRGLAQPAVKCRGKEYLRIIYGAEYTLPENLERLRSRGLSRKRSLALREFALGMESLERFTRKEPLRRVHECVFGVLALESEPVDPRL